MSTLANHPNHWMRRVAIEAAAEQEAPRDWGLVWFTATILIVLAAGIAWSWTPLFILGPVVFSHPEVVILCSLLSTFFVMIDFAAWRHGR